MTAVALGLLALVLSGPGPLWVARWAFLDRVPRAAVVLWQAGAVAALLSVFGAGLVVARLLIGGLLARDRSAPWSTGWLVAIGLLIEAFALLVLGRLIWSVVKVARATSLRRRRHRAAVDLLGTLDESMSLPGLRVLAEQLPIAYCLPSRRDARVVLSAGTLATLGRDEVEAVLAHESAHVRARHDLVLDAFTALHRAFPIAVRSELPAQKCRLLVEMLADDAARQRTGALPLARALVALAGSPVPNDALGAGGGEVAERVRRLSSDAVGWSRPLATAVYLLAAALVAGPVVIMIGGELLFGS